MWAIITLTKGGLALAKKIQHFRNDAVIYVNKRIQEPDTGLIEGRFSDFIAGIFNRYSVLIFIMASGIVVRSIASCLRNKRLDPGVLVIDEKGQYVISLLSGHVGGANESALCVSGWIGALPVITTSSDVNQSISVDMLAQKYGLLIDNPGDAKTVTAMIVNGMKVGIKSPFPIDEQALHSETDPDGWIVISNRPVLETKPYVRLIPRNLSAGIGCRKGKTSMEILEFIISQIAQAGYDLRALRMIASVEIKKKEKGLIETSEILGIPFVTISTDEINNYSFEFTESEWVRKNTGAGAVCEPAALLASGKKGRFVLRKTVRNGMTLALWEEDYW